MRMGTRRRWSIVLLAIGLGVLGLTAVGADGAPGAVPGVTDQEIVLGMNGNLCRCATYPRIVGAVKRASQMIKESNHG